MAVMTSLRHTGGEKIGAKRRRRLFYDGRTERGFVTSSHETLRRGGGKAVRKMHTHEIMPVRACMLDAFVHVWLDMKIVVLYV